MPEPCRTESGPEFGRDLGALGDADREATFAAIEYLASDPENGERKVDGEGRPYRRLEIEGERIGVDGVEVEPGGEAVGLGAHEVRRRLVLQFAVLERERGVIRPRHECRVLLLAVWDAAGPPPLRLRS